MSNIQTPEQHPFFRTLTAEQSAAVLALGKLQQFAAGDWLIEQQHPANHLYLLLSGRVQLMVPDGREQGQVLETLQAGDLLGWSWFTNPQGWHFSARAQSPVSCYCCDGSALRAAMDSDSALGYAILQQLVSVLAHRLQASRLQHLNMYGSDTGSGQ